MVGARQAPASPLAVGVTGHRSVSPHDERLRRAVLGQLQWLRETFVGRPLLVLSSLAEGADRLVARLAIDCHQASLVAPLPMPPQEYVADFAGAASRQEFWRLLDEADQWFALPGDAATGPEARARQYARAGAYIVEHCAVLIALWDGQPARGTGGTADLVKWKLDGRVPEEFSLAAGRPPAPPHADAGLVIQIHPHTYEVTHIPPRRV